ncbi:MAG: metallophosphoesterase [Sphingomonadales bacterium]|nr:metallophosphoesterase [Sphingomonadales bacterium]
MCLFHLSDLHFGAENAEALAWARRTIVREAPDSVAITGDLTMRARRREFAAACAWISALHHRITVEVGNHDLPYFNLLERFFRPYRRFRRIEAVVERQVDLPGLAIVPLTTTVRAQPRLDWSRGWVRRRALDKTLAALDALPADVRAIVAVHHPLVETGRNGERLTRGGEAALEQLARRRVLAVLSGHVHDPFDLVHETRFGPVRMIGAGTLSRRLRSTPPSFNVLYYRDSRLTVDIRTLDHHAAADMCIAAIPANATPPRGADDPVAAVKGIAAHEA